MRVAIVGAGFGGIGTAIRLRQAGFEDLVVFERADDVGGTWRDNSYPGCACDVPSHLYSFSFAPNPGWSRSFSEQAEIWDYLRRCVDAFNLKPHLRLGCEVLGAAWDPASRRWRLQTSDGPDEADVLIAAAGPLSEPSVPMLPGLATFSGETFHSARWNHDLDLTGRRVAVVGTGASSAQFVPRIAPGVARLHLFQRTPAWVLPRRDRAITALERRLFAAVPPAQRLVRAGIYWTREAFALGFLRPPFMRFAQRLAARHLRRSVADPRLRAALTPAYTMGCKRVVLSDDFYPALTRENVEVVTDAIAEVRPRGVVTVDGRVRDVDTIIFGTGFRVTDAPVAHRIQGGEGRSLAEAWHGSMRAYLGTTVHGFPNLFLLLGPNTGLGHNSVVFMAEAQIRYIVDALRHLRRTGAAAVEPTRRAQDDYVADVDRRMAGTVWLRGGCHSWYLDASGRNSTLWPGYSWTYRLRARRFDPAAYQEVARPEVRYQSQDQ